MNLSYNISEPDFGRYEFITLNRAKQQLKIDFDYEDDLIQRYIYAALNEVENYIGRFIFPRTVNIVADTFCECVEVEYLPLLTNQFTVTYTDPSSASNQLEGYKFLKPYGEKPKFKYDSQVAFPEVIEASDAVSYIYQAGYTPDTLPDSLYSAAMLLLSDLYEFRTDRPEIISTRAQSLMRPYKKFI